MSATFLLNDPNIVERAQTEIAHGRDFRIEIPADQIAQFGRSSEAWTEAEISKGWRRTFKWIRAYVLGFAFRAYWMIFVLARARGFGCSNEIVNGTLFVRFSRASGLDGI